MNARRKESWRRVDWWLVAIVVLASVIGAVLVSRARNWGLMTDELLYAEMARNVAGSMLPLPQARGEFVHVNQVLYPILIAPLLGPVSMPVAYPLLACFNAVLMATAAIPVYLLTRYASGSPVAARWAAACAVSLPWLAMASKILPDAAAYTAVMWSVYAIARTARGSESPRSTAVNDAFVLLTIVIAYLIRSQFIVLFGVWIVVVLLSRVSASTMQAASVGEVVRLAWRALWRTVLERPVVIGAFSLVVLVLLVRPVWLLGLYTSTVGPSSDSAVAPQGLVAALTEHVSVLAVALLCLPFVFGLPWLVAALGRLRDAPQHQTAVTLLIASAVLVYVAASFNQRFGGERVLERYLFYVAPLVIIGAACFFARPPRNGWLFAVPAAVGILLVNQTEPYGLAADVTLAVNHSFSPAQIGLVVVQKVSDVFGLSISWFLMVVGTICAVIAWVLIRRDRAQAAMAFVFTLTLIGLVSSTAYTVVKVVDHQNRVADTVYGERTADEKAWVDSAICPRCTASMVFSPTIDIEAASERDPKKLGGQKVYERVSNWWDIEFWNSQFDSLYLDDPNQAPSFGTSRPIAVDWSSGELALDPDDESRYLVVAERNPHFQPQPEFGSEPISRNGLVLYRLSSPPLAAWATRGLTRLGWIPPDGAMLRLYAPVWATGPTRARVTAKIAGTEPPYAAGVVVKGTDFRSRGNGAARTITWVADVPTGGHADFRLEWRGEKRARNAHVELISVELID